MELAVGDKATMTRAFSSADVAGYVALGGHAAMRGDVPEPLVNALFSRLLGVELPGQGTNYLKQESAFHETARVGEALTASVEVTLSVSHGSLTLGDTVGLVFSERSGEGLDVGNAVLRLPVAPASGHALADKSNVYLGINAPRFINKGQGIFIISVCSLDIGSFEQG